MKTKTRLLFTTWLAALATLNGVAEATVVGEKQFAVEPSVQQKLIDRQAESSAFLGQINIVPVDEQSGEKLGLGVAGTLAGRTDTDQRDRETRDPTTLDADRFTCHQTNFDTHVSYAKMDLWAKFKDFQLRLRNQNVQQQARDRIMIGWNGLIAARQTDRVANPLLEDVNIGWLQQIRTNRPTHVFASGEVDGKIVVAPAGGDYRNLDALVYDAIAKFLPEWVQGDTELVCIVGSGLLHEKYFPMVNGEDKPSEKIAADILMSKKTLGGKQVAQVPFFPAGTILITRLDNLSIYEQEGTRRKTVVDNAKRNRVETYESVNEAYVVENYDFALLIENIEVQDGE